jgi:signal transduction histidine kinase
MPQAARKTDANVRAMKRGAQARAPQEEQKRSFLRVVSHELRTPLNSILGFSEILASELYGPLGADQYREYAQIIHRSGEKLLKLVNQVVEITRLQTGDMELLPQPEPLAPLLEGLGEGLDDELAAAGLQLVIEPCVEAQVLADRRALRNVLANLLQNAVAFSPAGGVISVSAGLVGNGAEIVVRNDGDGVDPADLPRLLLPFEQGQNALTRRVEGAGLGLAICDLACRAMGGRLELVSAPGEGFAAYILLPTA